MLIREEFDNRVIEIESFYEILGIIELEGPKITAYDLNNSIEKIVNINSAKVDTLRSTAYLLLYNLIESTIYNMTIRNLYLLLYCLIFEPESKSTCYEFA